MRWLALPVVAVLGFAGGLPLLGLWRPALSGAAADYVTVGYHDLNKGSLPSIERGAASFARAAELAPEHPEVLAAMAQAELARADALLWTAARSAATAKAAGAATAAAGVEATEATTRELLQRANQAAERGFQSAHQALQADPRSPHAQLAVAEYYRLKGDLLRARPWRDAAAASGADADALAYFDAELASSEGVSSAAILASLHDVLSRDPKHQRARFLAAALSWAAGDHARARELAQQVLAASPDHERAAWYLDTADLALAQPDAPAEEEVDARDLKALLGQAAKLRTRDRTKQALELYDKALALQPSEARALVGKAWCLIDLDRPRDAAELLQPLVESKPRLGPALFALAQALQADGREGQALKYYRRYLKVSPEGADAEVARASVEQLGGE